MSVCGRGGGGRMVFLVPIHVCSWFKWERDNKSLRQLNKTTSDLSTYLCVLPTPGTPPLDHSDCKVGAYLNSVYSQNSVTSPTGTPPPSKGLMLFSQIYHQCTSLSSSLDL